MSRGRSWLRAALVAWSAAGLCFAGFLLTPATVDADGLLREPFALLPLGWLGLVVGGGALVVAWVRRPR
jgi:hypothetical protein